MHINIRHRVEGSVVHLEGDFLSEPEQQKVRDRIRAMVNEGRKHIIVDLSGIHHINSCGLGSLVCALVAARRAGGDVVLVSPGEQVEHLFEITKLSTVFHIYPSVTAALAEHHALQN